LSFFGGVRKRIDFYRPPIFHGTSSATVRPDLADSTIISIFECFKIVEFLDYFVPGITNRLALP